MSSAYAATVRKNNDLVRASLLVLKLDPKYRMTSDIIDRYVDIVRHAEGLLEDEPSIDLLGAYAETLHLVEQILNYHGMSSMAKMLIDNGEKVKKSALSPLTKA